MKRSEPSTFLASAAVKRGRADDERSPRMDSNRRPRLNKHEPRVGDWPIACMTPQILGGLTRRRRLQADAFLGSGRNRLDPEAVGSYLGPLLRTASTLCDTRESAEDLVQDTVTRVLSRPRWLRGGNELAYLTQALRNTFLSSRRTATRRPRVVTTLEELDTADRCTAARPEEAVIAAQVFPAIDRLPESFRLALVAVDVAGLSYGEAARVLGAPEATVTTRLYRARQRVARELDAERCEAGESKGPGEAPLARRTASPPR